MARIKHMAKRTHRYRPGTLALREIRQIQNLLIPAAPFIRTVREISNSLAPKITRWTAEALLELQEAAEDYNAMLCAIHARRVTLNYSIPHCKKRNRKLWTGEEEKKLKPSDSGAQPKRTPNNTLVGDMFSRTDVGEQHKNLGQSISGSEVAEEEVVSLDSPGITAEENCPGKDFCVKCGEGGNLLVCSNVSCPISSHKKCMNCPAMYDTLGKFYCPVCSCRRAEKKLALAKKYLSLFVAEETVDSDLQEQDPKRFRIEKPSPSTPKYGLDCEIQDQSVQVKKDLEEERSKKCRTTNVSPLIDVEASAADHASLDCGHQPGTETVQKMQEETLVGAKDGLDCDKSAKQIQIKKYQEEDRDKDCVTRSVSPLIGAEDGLDCDEIRKQKVHIEKGQQEGGDKNCCSTSISPHEGDGNDQGAYREDLHDGQTVLEVCPHTVIDGRQTETMFPNEQQMGHVNSDGVQEAAILNDDLLTVSDGEIENRKTVKEDGDTRMFKGGNSMEKVPEGSTDFNQRQKTTHLISEETKVAAWKSAGYVTTGSTCKKRNRKLAWTGEEEKKLKGGVEKFMGIMRKKISWWKILTFGVGVFDPSRTSDDLKDKARTMNGLRASASADHVEAPDQPLQSESSVGPNATP